MRILDRVELRADTFDRPTLSYRDAPWLAWRMATREIFQTYFGRGYRAVDFFLSRTHRRGHYLLAKDS